MGLNRESIEQLRDGTWQIDCIHMELIQNVDEKPTRFIGQGNLSQDRNGRIRYRMYPQSVVNVEADADSQNIGLPGTIVQPHRYYRLETQAQDGRRWQTAQTLPEVSVSHIGSNIHYLVSGNVNEVSCKLDHPCTPVKSRLTMTFFADVIIPFNSATRSEHDVGGRISRSYGLNVATISTSFGEFHITSKANILVVDVQSSVAFPEHFESRIVESLGLVLCTPLYWNYISRVENGIEMIHLRGQKNVVKSLLPRPVFEYHEEIDSTGDVWRLFERYLTLVCTHRASSYHPCSRHLFAVLEASAGSLTSRGLALGVAAEGIVKIAFPSAATSMEGLKEIIKPLQKYCVDWPNMPEGELGESLIRRLPGMIGQLAHVSAKDTFRALAALKVIETEHMEAWSTLRHTLAHGVTPDSKEMQELVDKCNKVMMLMYHLIFCYSNYEGGYKDYSTYGYPQKSYRGRQGLGDVENQGSQRLTPQSEPTDQPHS